MYNEHFGLRTEPFSISPDPRYLYMSERHRDGLAHLLYGIHKPGGFVQLTGEVGTGKTTLCRCLLEQLPPEVDVAVILNPRVTVLEFLASLCDELRIPRQGEPWGTKALVDSLHRYLLDAHVRGRRTVLIVDEAQQLPANVLEQIRLLTNLETPQQKLLQIILIGQPELTTLLTQRNLRQLNQRIIARFHLNPLRKRETYAYIRHRIRVSGGDTALFSRMAIRTVHGMSAGIPRLINILCDRALLAAYACGARRVNAALVRRAARDVRGTRWRPWVTWTLTWRAALAALGVVALTGALLAASGQVGLSREDRSPTTLASGMLPVPSLPPQSPPARVPGESGATDSGLVGDDPEPSDDRKMRVATRGPRNDVLEAIRQVHRDNSVGERGTRKSSGDGWSTDRAQSGVPVQGRVRPSSPPGRDVAARKPVASGVPGDDSMRGGNEL